MRAILLYVTGCRRVGFHKSTFSMPFGRRLPALPYANRKGQVGMRKKEEIEAYAEKLVQPIVDRYGFELVDTEYLKEAGSWYLRIFIDKEGGIAVDDCEIVSRELEVFLDEDDCIENSYILEVSSPGLGRPLKKEKDFARSIGRDVDVRLFKAVDGTKEFSGSLEAYDKESVALALQDGSTVRLERSNLALIRLAFDLREQ